MNESLTFCLLSFTHPCTGNPSHKEDWMCQYQCPCSLWNEQITLYIKKRFTSVFWSSSEVCFPHADNRVCPWWTVWCILSSVIQAVVNWERSHLGTSHSLSIHMTTINRQHGRPQEVCSTAAVRIWRRETTTSSSPMFANAGTRTKLWRSIF